MILQNYKNKLFEFIIANGCCSTDLGIKAIIHPTDSLDDTRIESPKLYIIAGSLAEAAKKLEDKGLFVKSIKEFSLFFIE
jgi:hypothetical protein